MLRTSLYLSAALAAMSATALADEVDDATGRQDTVTVTGLRDVAAVDVTASVTQLSAADLAVRAAPYVADQLRAVPGVGVSRSGSLGGLTQVRIRGGEANHTLVLLDGIEVSDPVTGETDFGLWSGLNVERIEVARGEQSALYGSDAIGGVVSLITGGDGVQGRAEYGSFETWRADLGASLSRDTGRIGFAVSGFSTEGVDSSDLGGERDGSESLSGLINGQVALGGDWSLRGLASVRTSESETDPDSDFDGLLDNADRRTDADQWLLGGVLAGQGFGLSHQIRASFNQVERDNLADGSVTDTATGERAKLAYSPSIELGTVSLSGLIDWDKEDYRVRDIQFGGLTDQDQSFETLGLAAEVRWHLKAFSANASVRHDDNDGRFEDAMTWRLGAAYRFDFGGKLRASAGRGVKNPTFTELFGFFPGSFVGNPDLKPETSTSWEIGWDQAYGDVTWSLTYFEAALEDEIFTAFNPDFTSTAQNRTGDSDRSGVEGALSWQVSDQVSVRAAASRIDSSNDSGIDEIRVPEWTGSAAINWQGERWRLGLAADYVGSQDDTDFGTFTTVELDPYWLVSATAEVPLSQHLALTLRAENLLDETVTDVFSYNGPGAGVFVGLKLR